MDNLVTIQNVRGYIDDKGTAWLNLEDVARGLGFVDNSKGVEYVKWDRVGQYLTDLNFSTQVSKDQFIPENIFYRLAMKAKNETAERFQAKVADEILPAIRKTGSYSIHPKTDDEIIALGYQKAMDKIKLLEPKAKKFDALMDSSNYQSMEAAAKVINIGRNTLFKILREHNILTDRNLPYQQYIDRGYFVVKEYTITINGEPQMYAQTFATAKGINFLSEFLEKQ